MNELVILKGNDVFTDSLVISQGTGVRHDKVKRSIEKYQKQLQVLGILSTPYQVESTGGRPIEVYLLNEQQATFLITLMKNTEVVVAFKLKLVQEFYKMRQFILEKQSKHWLEARQQGVLTRKAETEVIKQLVEYAKEQGSSNSQMLYLAYTKLANKLVGIDSRDNATIGQLSNLSFIEQAILKIVLDGMKQELHYKEIYQVCKERLLVIKELAFLEEMVA